MTKHLFGFAWHGGHAMSTFWKHTHPRTFQMVSHLFPHLEKQVYLSSSRCRPDFFMLLHSHMGEKNCLNINNFLFGLHAHGSFEQVGLDAKLKYRQSFVPPTCYHSCRKWEAIWRARKLRNFPKGQGGNAPSTYIQLPAFVQQTMQRNFKPKVLKKNVIRSRRHKRHSLTTVVP